MSRTGSCQCEHIRYTVEGDPLMTYTCHCKDCQKRTGSAFSMGTIYPLSAITITGKLSSWERTSDAGDSNTRMSCSQCGNIIYGVGSATPEFIKLQTGTLEDTSDIHPDAHIWTRSSQPWVAIPDSAIQHESQPENLLDVFSAVMVRREQSE